MRSWGRGLFLVLALSLIGCRSHTIYLDAPEQKIPRTYCFDSIVVEVVSQKGIQPKPQALQFFKGRLEKYRICNSNNVVFKIRSSTSKVSLPWTRDAVVAFEKQHRTLYDKNPKDKHLIIYIAYIQGPYKHKTTKNPAGLKYGKTSICLFVDRISEGNQGAVLLHEFGHLIKIADGRKIEEPGNPDRPDHCSNPKCVMFWRSDKAARFDDTCQQEINKLLK